MGEALNRFQSDVKADMDRRYGDLKGNRVVIWGIGNYGELLYQEFCYLGMKDDILCFCDDRDVVNHSYFHELEVLKPEEAVARYEDAIFVLASSYWHLIISDIPKRKIKGLRLFDVSLRDHEFEVALGTKEKNSLGQPLIFLPEWFEIYDKEKVELEGHKREISKILEDEESKKIIDNRFAFFISGNIEYVKELKVSSPIYFRWDYYGGKNMKSGKEVLLDCGTYIGDNLDDYMRFLSDGKCDYSEIHCFEPDSQNLKKCKERVQTNGWRNIQIHQSGVGKKKGIVRFSGDGTGGAMINDQGGAEICIEAIDDYYDSKPTMIKMDIEGAELDALTGAQNVIKDLKPKLAVSIYHKPKDFYEILTYLHELVPEYSFKVRHHTGYLYDTVLYAYV